MHILSPPRLIRTIDIADRALSVRHVENHLHGALVSIDLDCSENLFYGHKKLFVKFCLSFKTQIQDGFHRPVAIKEAKVGYFRSDNDIKKIITTDTKLPTLDIEDCHDMLKDGRVEVKMEQPPDASSIRIVVLLDAYPSSMELSAHLSTPPTSPDGAAQSSRAYMSASRSFNASSPDDDRLQRLLCWTAALGYTKLFAAYLDQGPSVLIMEDELGWTPFSWAAFSGQGPVIQLALLRGGTLSSRKKTAKGPSPLEAAARSQDQDIFDTFLKTLKYLKELNSDQPDPEEMPKPEDLPKLTVEELDEELKEAVSREQMSTIGRLVELLQPDSGREPWLAQRMVQAAAEGDLCLVQVLKSRGADINCKVQRRTRERRYAQFSHADGRMTTPLMEAILNGMAHVAEFLIIHGAEDDEALRTAVHSSQHSTIRALLHAGTPVTEAARQQLIEIASESRDSTTLMLLKLEKGTGKLATYNNLHRKVDKQFEATVVTFFENRQPTFQELSVDELMQKEERCFDRSKTSFKWFHLPANNMKWAEALIGKIHHDDPAATSKVFDPKRWAKRQHEGELGSAHARFMIPACHDFSEAFKHKKGLGHDNNDRHVLLFMPYLHWDEEEKMRERARLIAENASGLRGDEILPHEWKPRREELLMTEYLFNETTPDPNSRHVLHVRRTLDQSLYHNLIDTRIRDGDQAVHRYPGNGGNKEQRPIIMVDQLWLWILVGPSGKADTVVTCFPSRDWYDVGMDKDTTQAGPILDERRTTDVLQITKSYLQQRPNAVKSPYDLAGVIASRCSRALLDHSSDMLNFAEVYENSISSIMDEEAVLFNTFNTLMQTRSKVYEQASKPNETENGPVIENDSEVTPLLQRANPNRDLSKTIKDDLDTLESILKELLELKQSETAEPDKTNWPQKFTWRRLDSQPSPADKFLSGKKQSIESWEQDCAHYRAFARDKEIPDDDDLKGLSKATGEAKIKQLIALLEKFGRFYVLDITKEITLLRLIKDIQDELAMMEKVFAEQQELLESLGRIIHTMDRHNPDIHDEVHTRSPNTKSSCRSGIGRSRTGESQSLLMDRSHGDYDTDDDPLLGDEDFPTVGLPGTVSQDTNNTSIKQTQSIRRMYERAKNTNSALNTLVDLKQKQNNMIDTRTARLQAEQSHLMTLEAEKQGRTLMVFTIVTIVFLPLSFIAAFFAIPTKEFDNSSLTLGYVSKVTCELL
ncbi:hypothetical protein TgHK011_002667 [Trichoderma gracile]|nr:hypothetical protein TgHK011_002667 [Trichoderma gracile]